MQAKRAPQENPETFRLSLRIRHPSMDPEDITRALAIQPEHSFRAGTPRSSTGAKSGSAHAESYWLGALPPIAAAPGVPLGKDPLSDVARKQLAAVSRNLGWVLSFSARTFCKAHAEILRRIRAEGGEVTLLATIDASDEFTLVPETSQLLGELGIAIEFDVAAG